MQTLGHTDGNVIQYQTVSQNRLLYTFARVWNLWLLQILVSTLFGHCCLAILLHVPRYILLGQFAFFWWWIMLDTFLIFYQPFVRGNSFEQVYCLSNNYLRVAPPILKYQKFKTLLMSLSYTTHTYKSHCFVLLSVSFMGIPLLSPHQSSEQRLGFLFFVSTIAIAGQKKKKILL